MLKGLEVSEVWLRLVQTDEDLRLEEKYYSSKQIIFKCVKGENIESFSQYGTSKDLNEENQGYPILRLNEFDSFFISKPAKYCNLIDYATYESLKLKKNDVLICRTNGNPNYVGKAAIVPKDYDYAFASYLFRVRPNVNLINATTLVTFLNSDYGRKEIEKFSMVSNQANFSPAKFRKISIPLFSSQFNIEIEKYVYQAFDLLENSKIMYAAAEEQLLSELGLKDWQPENQNINVKNLSESFLSSGRLDAEYYQSKYDEIEREIASYYDALEIGNLCFVNQKNTKPKDGVQYKYIELSNINSIGEITGCTIDYGENLPTRARQVVKSGDVIVSSIEGSLDSCALVTPEYDNAFCSTGFYIIRSKIITSETLLVLMKLKPIQQLLKKGCSGTILTAINYDNFCNIIIPVPDGKIQTEISIKIQRCFALKKESKRLLEEAKMMVEQEIEKGGK